MSVYTRTFGAATVEDLKAEEHYKAVYAQQIEALRLSLQAFLPSGSNPGVCNVGGSAPACIEADKDAIEALRAFVAALEAITVPPRFGEPDSLLREAMAKQIEGLELRNQALITGDNTLWDRHATTLQAANTDLQQAYLAFPEDNRPFPPP